MPRRLLMFTGGFVLLAAIVLTSVWLNQRQENALGWIRHTLEVETRLATVFADLQEEQGAQRGFLLTGQPSYLGRAKVAVGRLDIALDQLGRMTSDNPMQRTLVVDLRRLNAQRQHEIAQTIDLYQRSDRPAVTDPAGIAAGQATMDQIRGVVGAMELDEERVLAAREQSVGRWALAVRIARFLDLVLILALAGYTFNDIARQLRLAERNAAALQASNAELQNQIDARTRAESQVRQLQKMESLGQLTGGIAHDFNNMLAVVMGSLDIAKRRYETDPQRTHAAIDTAMEGARRAAQLTARLLAFSRRQALEPRAVDLNKLVVETSELLRRAIGEQIGLETVQAGGLWRSFVDPNQLETTLVNLAVNARDAMPDGGKLTIETANAHLDDSYASDHADVEAGQYVMVSVTDTGCGMAPETIERAFDPFYTTKDVGKGTGLGLSQVFGFVKQSAGHVKIYSELGHGTTVKLYLPRYLGEQLSAELTRAPGAADLPRAAAGESVLVVEDDEHVRHVSADILRELGYAVIEAAGAPQALEILEQGARIDLLFTDIVMPLVNGRELADAAKKDRPDLRVLYTTGYTRNAVVHNGVVDGGVSLITKPYTVDQLAAKVRKVLDY